MQNQTTMTSLKNYLLPVLSVVCILATSCESSEIGESKDVNPETVYQDYKIEFTEGENENQADVVAQFRFAGAKGTTLVLTKPSAVSFDGAAIAVDSAEFTGAYYKTNLPAEKVFGKHHFEFADVNNRKRANEFTFDKLSLHVPSHASQAAPLYIPFETAALNESDYIEVNSVNSDSSFTVLHPATDTTHFITIPVKELQRQKGNSLTLSFAIYRKMPLLQHTKEGGEIRTVYGLKPVSITLTGNTGYASLQ